MLIHFPIQNGIIELLNMAITELNKEELRQRYDAMIIGIVEQQERIVSEMVDNDFFRRWFAHEMLSQSSREGVPFVYRNNEIVISFDQPFPTAFVAKYANQKLAGNVSEGDEVEYKIWCELLTGYQNAHRYQTLYHKILDLREEEYLLKKKTVAPPNDDSQKKKWEGSKADFAALVNEARFNKSNTGKSLREVAYSMFSEYRFPWPWTPERCYDYARRK